MGVGLDLVKISYGIHGSAPAVLPTELMPDVGEMRRAAPLTFSFQALLERASAQQRGLADLRRTILTSSAPSFRDLLRYQMRVAELSLSIELSSRVADAFTGVARRMQSG